MSAPNRCEGSVSPAASNASGIIDRLEVSRKSFVRQYAQKEDHSNVSGFHSVAVAIEILGKGADVVCSVNMATEGLIQRPFSYMIRFDLGWKYYHVQYTASRGSTFNPKLFITEPTHSSLEFSSISCVRFAAHFFTSACLGDIQFLGECCSSCSSCSEDNCQNRYVL